MELFQQANHILLQERLTLFILQILCSRVQLPCGPVWHVVSSSPRLWVLVTNKLLSISSVKCRVFGHPCNPRVEIPPTLTGWRGGDRSCVLNAQAIPPHSPTSKYIHLSRYSKDITLLYPSKGKNMNKKRFSPLGVHYLEEGGESYKQWHLNLFGQILFWDSYENHKLSSEKFTEANSCKTRLNAWATASESLEYLSSWLLATKGFH